MYQLKMSTSPQILRAQIAQQKSDLAAAESHLAHLERQCGHRNCTPTVYDPIVKEGFQFHGDPEGTCGIDRRLPAWIPREETPRWRRECKDCGLIQYTFNCETETKQKPIF